MDTQKVNRWKKRLGVTALFLATVYAVITLTPWSIGICSEEVTFEAYSPDESYLARVYVRNCGATTGYLTHVNLRSRWIYFNTRWFGTIVQGQVFANACGSKTTLLWRDNSNLEIDYVSCRVPEEEKDPAFMKAETWGLIDIAYLERPPED